MPNQLSQDAFIDAAKFISDNGTDLHRARYRFHFENQPAQEVTRALATYQNDDGGFGHGLEGDLRTKNSSVLCSTVALQILKEIDADPHSVMIADTMNYLVQQYRHKNWSLINSECNDAPHAPWWKHDGKTQCRRYFYANPGAEILSNLLSFPVDMCRQTLSNLTVRALAHLETESLDMHDLLCYTRLYESVDPDLQGQMLPHLLRWAFELVKVDAFHWEEYCLTPLDVVKRPDSIFSDFFGAYLEQNFAFMMDQQRTDGSWQTTWSWGGEYPATWQVVEPEISAEVTLRFLLRLKAFNMLS